MKFDGPDPDKVLRKKFATIADSSSEGETRDYFVNRSIDNTNVRLAAISPTRNLKAKNNSSVPPRIPKLVLSDESSINFNSD
jgi:hypothetical protein